MGHNQLYDDIQRQLFQPNSNVSSITEITQNFRLS